MDEGTKCFARQMLAPLSITKFAVGVIRTGICGMIA